MKDQPSPVSDEITESCIHERIEQVTDYLKKFNGILVAFSGGVDSSVAAALLGFGAGLTWAAAAVEWSMPLPVRPVPWWRVLFRHLRYRWAWLRSFARRALRKLAVLLLGPAEGNGWLARLRTHRDR